MTVQEVFGDDLRPDPSVALPPCPIPVRTRSGPLPRLQFVIEFVGPRSVNSALAAALLTSAWQNPLGNPKVFAMSAADLQWQPLHPNQTGSYDSLCLAWDLISDRGHLSSSTAGHLLATAEQFAAQIQRRAMPMPIAADVDPAVIHLQQVQQNFDAGVSLLILPRSEQVSEFELWIWLAHLGLTPNLQEGSLEWLVPASPLPLFSATPLGDSESFTLEAAKRGDQAKGVLLGFNIPRSPEPMAGLEGMFRAADWLAQQMWGTVFDEDDRPLDESGRQTLRAQLAQAVQSMENVGILPGSPEALALF